MTAPAKKSSVESLPDRIFKDPDTDLYYSYQATRESGQRKFFLCSLNHSHGCNGQGTLDSDGVFRYLDEKDEDAPKYRHNHVGEADLLEDAIFLKEMHSLLCHSFLQNKAIYNKLKILYPSAALKYPFEQYQLECGSGG
ncbi:uncharacterized protein LOC123270170 [Cotesia glomerata]|uniref:uncharacterized protein LOC123270170 n=1 Tax=Cotesia glomerata TaxID=32391 RepID=UPI001D020169|nr:uncharacterized protein LOC123270170 [Cotesia glomerata]